MNDPTTAPMQSETINGIRLDERKGYLPELRRNAMLERMVELAREAAPLDAWALSPEDDAKTLKLPPREAAEYAPQIMADAREARKVGAATDLCVRNRRALRTGGEVKTIGCQCVYCLETGAMFYPKGAEQDGEE